MDNTHLILIVEDDNDLREAICDTVRLSNFSVMEASNAEEALEILAIEQIDLIISDVQMPGIDGHEFLNVYRKRCLLSGRVLRITSSSLSKQKSLSR